MPSATLQVDYLDPDNLDPVVPMLVGYPQGGMASKHGVAVPISRNPAVLVGASIVVWYILSCLGCQWVVLV
jgi:hypothetical protein